jgi:hypothetical protein
MNFEQGRHSQATGTRFILWRKNSDWANDARKWGIGLCVTLWFGAGFIAMLMPICFVLIIRLPEFWTYAIITSYVIFAVPLITYHRLAKPFGLTYGPPITDQKTA